MQAVSGYIEGRNVIILQPGGRKISYPAEYTAYSKTIPTDLDGLNITRSGQWIRIKFRSWEHRKAWVAQHPGFRLWEADVSPLKRVLADNDIEIARPRRGYLDIEWDSRVSPSEAVEGNARVLCWALVDELGFRYTGLLESDTDASEKSLLEALVDTLEGFDQICGWYLDDADRPVLEARGKLLGVKFPARLHWMDQLAAFKRMNLQTAQSGDEKTSFSLNNIARVVLKEGKIEYKRSKTWEGWLKDKKALLDYCIQDADLLRKIENKTGFLDLNFTICQTCNIFPNSHSLKPTAQMDGWFLRRARKEGKHLPSRPEGEETDQYEGAYVMPPTTKGIIRDVRVIDFAAMYPSIMMSLNMSLETKIPDDETKYPFAKAPLTGKKFRIDIVGDMAKALKEFSKLRKIWKQKKKEAIPESDEWVYADRQQNCFKVLMNSLYGVTGCPWSRFYDADIAESVSTTGKWLIQQLNELAKGFGLTAIYSDTDGSYFIGLSHEEFIQFTSKTNTDILPKLASDIGCIECNFAVDYEKAFDRIVFPSDKDGNVAAKRYCGKYSHYAGKPVDGVKVEVKGLEVKRGDSSRLARRMQQELIDLLMSGEENPDTYESFVGYWRKRITLDKVELSDIVLSKSVKSLDSYKTRVKKDGTKGSQPAHVEIAKTLKERGEEVNPGDRVEYVVVDADVSPMKTIPAADYDGNFDRRFCWNDVVYPPSYRLLVSAIPSRNWEHYILPKPKKALQGQLGLF